MVERLMNSLSDFRYELQTLLEDQAREISSLRGRMAEIEKNSRSRSRSRSSSRGKKRKQRTRSEPSNYAVHVTMIKDKFTSTELERILALYGPVESVNCDRRHNEWAKVTFTTTEAQRACLNDADRLSNKHGFRVRVHKNIVASKEEGEI